LSFTLGFFVGKNSGGKRPEPLVATPPQPVAVENPQSATAAQTQTSSVSDGPVKNVTGPAIQDKTKNGQPAPLQQESGRVEDNKAGAAKEEAKDTPKDIAKKERHETGGTAGESSAKTDNGAALYTVQLGALKSAAEARSLKAAYAKKGYKTYIAAARNSRNEKIYKVRAGEFREKKEAEILAHRLKKNEGLAAFVTVKND